MADLAVKEFEEELEDLGLAPVVETEILKRWIAGREKFAGTLDDCLRADYDVHQAQAEELMDAVAYGIALELRGDGDRKSRMRMRVAAILLDEG